MSNANDMSRCLAALDQDTTIIAVVDDVPPACWRPQRTDPAHYHCGVSPQAADCAVALFGNRRGAGRSCSKEGVMLKT